MWLAGAWSVDALDAETLAANTSDPDDVLDLVRGEFLDGFEATRTCSNPSTVRSSTARQPGRFRRPATADPTSCARSSSATGRDQAGSRRPRSFADFFDPERFPGTWRAQDWPRAISWGSRCWPTASRGSACIGWPAVSPQCYALLDASPARGGEAHVAGSSVRWRHRFAATDAATADQKIVRSSALMAPRHPAGAQTPGSAQSPQPGRRSTRCARSGRPAASAPPPAG